MNLSPACSSVPLSGTCNRAMDVAREEEIKGFVRSFKAVPSCHTVDRLPRYGYAMDSEMRKQRITSRLAEIVRVQHQVGTGYFQFFHPLLNGEEEERVCVKELMNSVLTKGTHDSELSAYVESRNHKDNRLVFPDDCIEKGQVKKNDENHITLLKSKKLADRDRIGIYNIGKEPRRLILNKGDPSFNLNSLEGAVFDAVDVPGSGLTWHLSARYCRNKKTEVDMNPMLIEDSTGYGEVFLPPDAVQDLVASTREDGFKPPLYHFSGDPKDLAKLKTGIKKEFIKNDYSPLSFVVMNDCDCHMVAVRLMHINDRVVIYIHEGLSPVGMEAKATRLFVIQGVKQAIPKDLRDNIICLTTSVPEKGEKPFQVDYRSCGTIATDVIIDFDKAGFGQSLNDWLTSIIKRADIDSWSIIQQEEGETCLSHSADKRNNSQVKELFIPLDCMHALLLKHYQGDRTKLTPGQLATGVDEFGRTLEGYYKLLCQENGGRNISPDFWTYTYLQYWQEMIDKFQSISLDMSYGKLNSWLKKYHGFQVLPEDWSMLKKYDQVMHTEAPLDEWREDQLKGWIAEIRKLTGWLDKLINAQKLKSAAKTKGFIFSWCQYINDNLDNEFSEVWRKKTPEALLSLIRKNIEQINRMGRCPAGFHAGAAALFEREDIQNEQVYSISPNQDKPCLLYFSDTANVSPLAVETSESSQSAYCDKSPGPSAGWAPDGASESEDTVPAILEQPDACVEERKDEECLITVPKLEDEQVSGRVPHRKRHFLPTVLDHRPKKEKYSTPFAQVVVEKTDSSLPLQNVAEQDREELLVPSFIAMPSVKLGAISPESISKPKTEVPFGGVGSEEPAEDHNNNEVVLSTSGYYGDEKDCSNESVAVEEQEHLGLLFLDQKRALSSAVRNLDVPFEHALQNLVTANSINPPISIKSEPIPEYVLSCSHDYWPINMTNQPLPLIEKEKTQVVMSEGDRSVHAGFDGLFRIKVEDSSYASGFQRFDHIVSDDESVSSMLLPVEREHEPKRYGRKQVTLAEKEEKKRIRKEKNKLSARNSREKKKNNFEVLKSEVSSFVDIKKMEEESRVEARKVIIPGYIQSVVASGCYANDPVFQRYSVEDVSLQIAKTYGPNEAGLQASGIIEDRAFKAFKCKVKNRIESQISRDTNGLLIGKLERVKEQLFGASTSKLGSDHSLPCQP